MNIFLLKLNYKQSISFRWIVIILSVIVFYCPITAQENCDAEIVFSEFEGECQTYSDDFYCVNADLNNSFPNVNPTTSFVWLMGDGNTKTGKKIQHCYKSYGKYTITILVKSLVGKINVIDTTYHEVDISNFALFNPQKLENKQFYFDASESFIDNEYNIKKYYWAFGDGNFQCENSNPLAYHQFDEAGNYQIKLIVEGKNENGEARRTCGTKMIRVD